MRGSIVLPRANAPGNNCECMRKVVAEVAADRNIKNIYFCIMII